MKTKTRLLYTTWLSRQAELNGVAEGTVVGEKQFAVDPSIQQKLIEHGMQADMPVALVENGTSIKQRVVSGVLTQLGDLAQQVESPALIVVGRVVALRDKLNWFSNH